MVSSSSKVSLSPQAARPKNRIRKFVESLLEEAGKNDKGLPRMDLSLGDPTALGLAPPAEAREAIVEAMDSLTTKQAHGYQHSCGSPAFREAIAKEIRPSLPTSSIFVTSGCSQALQFALVALAKGGSNVLIPNPCFPLYNTICEFANAEARPYALRADAGWEASFEDLEAKCDEDTCCLLVCNPGNPTSHSYTQDHVEALLRFAHRKRIPVVADEVYAHMTYSGEFQYMAEVATARLGRERPPILSCSALSKRFLVPGWRIGWLALYDDDSGSLSQGGIPMGIAALCQIGMTPNSLVQAAGPAILEKTPKSYHANLRTTMARGAEYCMERCRRCPGLECASEPKGAMYLFFKVPGSNDKAWTRDLLSEENVFCLPGTLFGSPGFVRIVSAAPMEILAEAWDRIERFTNRDYVQITTPGK